MHQKWDEIKKRFSNFIEIKLGLSFVSEFHFLKKENKFNTENDIEWKTSKKWILFLLFLGILLFDRIFTLFHFGFEYTDLDQVVMWNGALDYSKGIFHEPFFYGQPYNYMLESLIASPLLWFGVPVYIALPISTVFISIFPFIILSLFLLKYQYYFWGYLCLIFPVLMPLEYDLLTTISRGFIQAHLFIPLLFFPLFSPDKSRYTSLLFIASTVCIMANQSSFILVLPVVFIVFSYHLNSKQFYLKSLIVIPLFFIDKLAKIYYKIHPEKVVHKLEGLKVDSSTFLTSLKNNHLFENLFPFISSWGIVYPFLFLILAIVAWKKSMKKEFYFITLILGLLILTLAIPKIQELYPLPNSGLFFSSSRLYLYLPFLLILSLFLIFYNTFRKVIFIYSLLFIGIIFCFSKLINIDKKVNEICLKTSFPISKNDELLKRAINLKQVSTKFEIDLIVQSMSEGWPYIFDSYAYNPLIQDRMNPERTISVSLIGDRRSWLYTDNRNRQNVLLNGINIDTTLLREFDFEKINQNQIVIRNNKLKVHDLITVLKDKLDLE